MVSLSDDLTPQEEIVEQEEEVEDEKDFIKHIDPKTLYVLKDIHDKIFSRNQNFLGIVVGKTGSGKTYSSLAMAEMLDSNFSVDRVIFDLDDLINFVTQEPPLPKGSVIVIDEFGVMMSNRDWQSEANKKMSKILQTIRFMNYYFFFTVPSLNFIDSSARRLLHYVFKTKKIIKRTKECVVRPYKIDLDALDTKGEPYRKFMHIWVNGHHKKITDMKVKIPSVKLRHAYEKKKRDNLIALYKGMKKKEVKDISND